MRVEQAMYGPSRGGHAMIAASGLHEVALDLTSRLDLPDTTPAGVSWTPYLTGFPIGAWYVLARTIADEEASRAGMVFSHALIAPLREIVRFDDLRQLTSLLVDAPTRNRSLDEMDILAEPAGPAQLTPEELAAIDLLISSPKKPIVRLGTTGFADLITNLWRALWPELRSNFGFRMSFGPNDLVEEPPPSLVCTPANLSSRWFGFSSLQGKSSVERVSAATSMLFGSDQGQPVRALTRSLGIQVGKFSELSLLNRLQELYGSGARDLSTSTAKLRLIEVLSEGRIVHAVGRNDLIDEVVASLPGAAPSQVRSLRNLDLAAFERASDVWAGLKRWTAAYPFPPEDDGHSLEIIVDAYDSERALPSWRAAITGGLTQARSQMGADLSRAFWRLLSLCDASKMQPLMDAFVAEGVQEDQLIAASPSTLGCDAVDTAMRQAATRGLLKLHAVLAAAKYPPLKAAKIQLGADSKAANPAALRLAVRKANPEELVAIALKLRQDTFTELAAESAASAPDVLKGIELADAIAQDLWAQTLQRSRAAWRGPREPENARDLILDLLILNEALVSSRLVDLLAETPLANLRSYRRRRELWTHVRGTTRQRFMAETGQDFLKGILEDDALPLEAELQDHMLQSAQLSHALRELITRGVVSAIRLISELTRMSDSAFRQLASLFVAVHLGAVDASSLGRIVHERRWVQSAEYMVQFARQGREDVKVVLRECQGLLGFWDRFGLGLGMVNNDEKWNSFAELSSSLYPEGPNDREIWQRAGGKNADLIYHGDGRRRWYDAINKIRRGNSPRSWELLAKMREDFSSNENLRSLANDPEFRRHGES